jgi:hypothetical protein
MGTNRNLFRQKRRESQQLFFGLRLVSRIIEEFQQPAIQSKRVQHSGVFFHEIKVRQPVGGKDSTVYNPSAEEVGGLGVFLYEATQNLSSFSIYSRSKLKNQKSTTVGVLIRAYPLIPLLYRSNLSGRYLKTHAETKLTRSLYNSFHFIKMSDSASR